MQLLGKDGDNTDPPFSDAASLGSITFSSRTSRTNAFNPASTSASDRIPHFGFVVLASTMCALSSGYDAIRDLAWEVKVSFVGRLVKAYGDVGDELWVAA